jgi:hypothetical protein
VDQDISATSVSLTARKQRAGKAAAVQRDLILGEGAGVSTAKQLELFHGLIRSRAREGGIPIPRDLPDLDDLVLDDPEPKWFPVPGMYGGFSYQLQAGGNELQLVAESWTPVVDV